MKGLRVVRPWLTLVIALVLFSPGSVTPPAGAQPSGSPQAWTPWYEWQIECADCPPGFRRVTDRSLAIDAAGTLHAAVAGDHLYYARHTTAGWQLETVDGDVVTEWSVLALDAEGRPHIGYQDADEDSIKYAWHDGSAWQVETVSQAGRMPALAIDGDGQPHILYNVDDTLVHTWRETAGWQAETVDRAAGLTYLYSISLAADRDGRLHVAYHELPLSGQPAGLKYAWHDGSRWHVQTVDDTDGAGTPCSLAVDELGRPHIGYTVNVGNVGDLRYTWHDGTTWHRETLVAGSTPSYVSLVLDQAGRPHMSYGSRGLLHYAWRDGVGWHVEIVADPVKSDWGVSLVLDELGRPHILSVDVPDYRQTHLRYAWYDGTAWQAEWVQRGGTVGNCPSLAVDSAGREHVAYRDMIWETVKYAWDDGSAWHTNVVDAGACPSLVLDSADRAHVSYSSDGVKYAWYDGAIWHVEPVDGGKGGALALDAANRPHIAYCGANGGARYAWHDAVGWDTEQVSNGETCPGLAFALDPAGRAHMVFVDWSAQFPYTETLFYAWRDGTSWQVESLVTENIITGGRLSQPQLAVDPEGRPHIAYTHWLTDGGLLLHAWRDEGQWYEEPVDSLPVGEPSLAIDASGQPHIASLAWLTVHDGNDLVGTWGVRYTRRVDTGWQVYKLGVGTRAHGYVSLALDRTGRPHIAYQAANPGTDEGMRLLVARRLPGPAALKKEAAPAHGVYAGQPITYTLTFDGPGREVELWDPLPANVEYISGTVSLPAVYNPTAHAVVWHGTLPTNTLTVFQFQVTAAFTGTAPLPIVNTAWLTDVDSGSVASSTAIVNGVRFYLPLIVKPAG